MVRASNLGFPRLGAQRELKKAVEDYWAGKIPQEELLKTAKELRSRHRRLQKEAGISQIPSNDFSFYDHVLDTACLFGVIPERFAFQGDAVDLETYFAMARGVKAQGKGPAALEMTKWFDTNYHYLVPEIHSKVRFRIASQKIFQEFEEAKREGYVTRPVLPGPVSFLILSKPKGEKSDWDRFTLLEGLIEVYAEVLKCLADQGAQWVQLDEPAFVMDREENERRAFEKAYRTLRGKIGDRIRILLASYFEGLRENRRLFWEAPVDGIHLDLVRAPWQWEELLKEAPKDRTWSLGVVDGRNVWKDNLTEILPKLHEAVRRFGEDRVWVAPSCSLLHVPVDLESEKKMDPEIRRWLAFAKQKLQETALLTRLLNGEAEAEKELEENRKDLEARRRSPKIHRLHVKDRVRALKPEDGRRKSPFSVRRKLQQDDLKLPPFPTTTIGSFPQTAEIRKVRKDHREGKISEGEYRAFLRRQIEEVVRVQEALGLDVLVHGEPERNDMVEYFGEQLEGFVFTENGWVQSYGSRGVKPPILFGDVERLKPMTVEWITYAQSLTKKPMKGMLTGPITILQWSFVRDDQPRKETALQVALALRDEVWDLEKAGIRVIQVDEPAIREGLPLRRADRPEYLEWAVYAFRVATCGVKDETQIHTHMCYSEFNEIIEAIAAMDADVITVEASRSDMELLEAFRRFQYPNDIGPGVYDIHSPRVPSKEEIVERLQAMVKVLPAGRLWVNPDCGLKTRGWDEVKPALKNMVDAAKEMGRQAAVLK